MLALGQSSYSFIEFEIVCTETFHKIQLLICSNQIIYIDFILSLFQLYIKCHGRSGIPAGAAFAPANRT
jgi:hypothetical protein